MSEVTVGLAGPPQIPAPLASWRIEGERIVLQAAVCGECGQLSFPPTPNCFKCGAFTEHPQVTDLEGRGTAYTFSEVHVAPPIFKVPYVVGFVDLVEGLRVFAQIHTPIDRLHVGDEVSAVAATVRSDGDEPVRGYAFVRADD